MSMVTGAVGRSLRDVARAGKAASELGQQLLTGKKVNAAPDGPSTWLQASRAQSTAGLLDTIHTGLTELAMNISVADTAMQAIGSLLATIRRQLEEAREYPPGDPARQALIAGANSVRRQIDDIVYTSTQTGARNLMSDPARDPEAGNIAAMVGIHGEVKIVHGQQVDTGTTGLALPAVPVNASDAQLQAALQTLRSAEDTLEDRRNGLAADAAQITRYISQTSSLSDLYESESESLTGVDETEAALELQSVNVQQALAIESLVSIGSSRDAILELLH